MIRRSLNILLSLLLTLAFLWLAFRQVHLPDLVEELTSVRIGWVAPFAGVLLLSHFLRAERWRLIIASGQPRRLTLFAAVMLGYMANYVIPRLGEVSRPVYAAQKMEVSSAGLFGTIVIERFIDLLSLAGILFVITLFYLGDNSALDRLFGTGEWGVILFLLLPVALLTAALLFWFTVRLLRHFEIKRRVKHPLLVWLIRLAGRFLEGLSSIRKMQQWPLFLLYTVGIWLGYIVMTWLPFRMLELQTLYGLGFGEALILTVIAAVGISIPTPGGTGSYHLLVQQGLWYLFSVPLATGLTYATVTHAVTLLVVVLAGGLILWLDKYDTLRMEGVR